MLTPHMARIVSQRLFATEKQQVFAVLDGASVPDLRLSLYQHQPEYACLYLGDLAPDMAEVAPYLVRLEADADFTEWVIRYGWGQHWGIFVSSDATLRELHRHFRRLLTVHDSAGTPLLFRYYDPRVLRVYLPTCTAAELEAFFGPVEWYMCEDDTTPAAWRLHLLSNTLQQDRLMLA